MIHQLPLRKFRHLAAQPARPEPGKFRYRLDIDIERVEKQPAVGRVGAGSLGTIIKQDMQGIERHARSPEPGRELDQADEIGEVAVAPVAS